MGRRAANTDRKRFETGRSDDWSTGGYGSTVRLFRKAGKLKISWQDPATRRTRTRTLFSTDSVELRQRATRLAVAHAEKLRSGELEHEEQHRRPKLEDLTVFDVCVLYMERVPGFEARLFDASEKEIRDWYDALPDSVRALDNTPSRETVVKDVRSFRHLFRSAYPGRGQEVRPFDRTRRVTEIEPGDSTKLMAHDVQAGRSPRTVANEHDRLSAAFRYVMRQHRKSIGLLYNPIDGRMADRSRARIPLYTPEEIGQLLSTAREWLARGKRWQAFVVLGLSSSGRRRQSIVALTAADHDFEAGTVVWRARSAKAGNYGRGDSVRPMTAMHRTAALWAIQNRPNPRGSEAPLVWVHGGRAMEVETVSPLFRELEAAAGIEHVRGRSIHSMRRAVVTLLSDALGDGKAAEYVDMTVETVRAHSYKQVQPSAMKEAAGALDLNLPNAHEEGGEGTPK
jgi:integrase